MNNEIIIALIGLIGVISGAAITAIIQYFNAKQKVEELRMTHAQKIQEKMIESARNHLDDLYLPLYKQISSLHHHYVKYRNIYKIIKKNDNKGQKEVRKSLDAFQGCITNFDKKVQEIFDSGDTAYLIGTLEERLIEVRDFLNKSKREPKSVIEKKITTTLRTSVFGVKLKKTFTKVKEVPVLKLHKKFDKISFFPRLSPIIKVVIETRLLKAPLSSDAFEQQFISDIIEIKREIKEVTLWLKE